MNDRRTTTQRNHRWSDEDDSRLAEIVEDLRDLKDKMQAQTEQKYSRRAFYDAVAGVFAVRHNIFITGKACDQRLRNLEKKKAREAREAQRAAKVEGLEASLTTASGLKVVSPVAVPMEHFAAFLGTLQEQVERMAAVLDDRTVTSRAVDAEIDATLKHFRNLMSRMEDSIHRIEMAAQYSDWATSQIDSLQNRLKGGKNDN